MAYGSGDGTSDCFRGYGDVEPRVLGLRLFLGEPANGVDVLTVCHTIAENGSSEFSSEFSLLDPDGRVWTNTTLRTADEPFTFGANATTSVTASPVETIVGGSWYPVGRTFVENGFRYTTVYLSIPVDRAAGSWTVRSNDETATSQPIHACTVSDGVGQPWILDFDLAYVPIDAAFDQTPRDLLDNCRLQRDLVNLSIEDAVELIVASLTDVGLDDPIIDVSGTCTTVGSPVVVASSPALGHVIGRRTNLEIGPSCPALPDVIGRSVDDATAMIEATWPAEVEPIIQPQGGCSEPDAVVLSTFPRVGDPTVRTDLFCI